MNGNNIGILFDFNGTMFFDQAFQEKAWRSFLRSKLGREVSNEEFQEYVHGRNAGVILSYFLQRELSGEEVAALEEEKEQIYRELCLNNPDDFKLARGLPRFLDELVQRKISITIATASALNNVRFFFENFALDQWFDLNKVVYNDGMIPGKPEPDIYLKAAEKINVNIKNCIVFEDAKSGIEAAKKAGAGKIIGVSSMLDEVVLLSFGAKAAIKDYSDRNGLFESVFS